jgi:hypothetical protein
MVDYRDAGDKVGVKHVSGFRQRGPGRDGALHYFPDGDLEGCLPAPAVRISNADVSYNWRPVVTGHL